MSESFKSAEMEPEFPVLKNDRIVRVLKGEVVDYVPVWIMRQAGRYLPEFREIRRKYEFFKICKTPELASEVTIQPLRRYNLDAAIIFSDILVILDVLGMKVDMVNGVGPVIADPLVDPQDINNLKLNYNLSTQLDYVYEAIKMTRQKLKGKAALIGFAGSPWTLFTYMVEGGSSKTMSKSKKWLYQWPEKSHEILRILNNIIIQHLILQAQSGAQVLQVFESHADHLTPDLFKTFCAPYLKEIAEKIKKKCADVPTIIFAKGANYALHDLSTLGFNALGIDWMISPEKARVKVSPNTVLQGNLDPCALYANDDDLKDLVKNMVHKFGKKNYIANLGHGIYPDTDPAKVKLFIDTIHSL